MFTPEFVKENWISTREVYGGDILIHMNDYYSSKEEGYVLNTVLAEYPSYQIVSIAYEPTNAMGNSRLVLLLRKKDV